jgi:hypothetical protein
MRDEHYRTQNSTKIVQPRGDANGIIFCTNLCCTKHFCATWLIVNGPLEGVRHTYNSQTRIILLQNALEMNRGYRRIDFSHIWHAIHAFIWVCVPSHYIHSPIICSRRLSCWIRALGTISLNCTVWITYTRIFLKIKKPYTYSWTKSRLVTSTNYIIN